LESKVLGKPGSEAGHIVKAGLQLYKAKQHHTYVVDFHRFQGELLAFLDLAHLLVLELRL
jgi:hypothetical protein